MAKFLIYLKKGTVFCRITLTGQTPCEISTGQKVDPVKWDPDKKRMKGNSPTAESVNKRLEVVITRLRNIETDLEKSGVIYSAKTIKEIYEGKGSEQKGLIEVFKLFVEHLESQPKNVRLADVTFERYRTRLKNTEAYVQWTGKKDIHLPQVDDDFMEAFRKWLMSEKKWGVGYTAKHLETVKQVMRYARQKKYTTVNHVESTRIEKENYAGREIVYLTTGQLARLEQHPFEGKLQEVAHCAIVQAHTGLAYQELSDLRPDWFVKGIDGGQWIQFYRQKTIRKKKFPVRVPLDDTVLGILHIYKEHPECELTGRCLPVMSNAAYNRNLKIIAGVLSLPPALSSHHFRKTAGMLWLNGGVPIETVAAMLGDTVEVTKTHYARVIEERIARDMAVFASRNQKNQS